MATLDELDFGGAAAGLDAFAGFKLLGGHKLIAVLTEYRVNTRHFDRLVEADNLHPIQVTTIVDKCTGYQVTSTRLHLSALFDTQYKSQTFKPEFFNMDGDIVPGANISVLDFRT